MEREDALQRFPNQDTPSKINERRKIRPDHEKSGTGRIQGRAPGHAWAVATTGGVVRDKFDAVHAVHVVKFGAALTWVRMGAEKVG